VKLQRLQRYALFGVALLFVHCIASAAHFADAVDDVARVYDAVDARLTLMSEIAAWKWVRQRPIVDEDRERAVIEGMAEHANEFGLNPDSIRRVFQIQVQMARSVQTEYFEEWRRQGFPATRQVRDLDTDLRPALDALGDELLAALYWAHDDIQKVGATDATTKALRRIALHPGVTAQDLSELRAVLHGVRAAPRNVDTIALLHVLRIGTTGDYAPFSFDTGSELRGVDIELAQALANHLGLTPRFVRTAWTSLLSDLDAGRFDIAMSGISNTPERAARAEFSTAYHFDGKTVLARCEDRAKFGSLGDIDHEQVRIIVNAGGTNQQFVREHIEHAKVIVHPDNRTMFGELIGGRADVTITDAIEVELQTRRHKELCRTITGTLTNAAKAVLLPRGSSLAKDVDQWLQAEVARGGVQEKLRRAMADD